MEWRGKAEINASRGQAGNIEERGRPGEGMTGRSGPCDSPESPGAGSQTHSRDHSLRRPNERPVDIPEIRGCS